MLEMINDQRYFVHSIEIGVVKMCDCGGLV